MNASGDGSSRARRCARSWAGHTRSSSSESRATVPWSPADPSVAAREAIGERPVDGEAADVLCAQRVVSATTGSSTVAMRSTTRRCAARRERVRTARPTVVNARRAPGQWPRTRHREQPQRPAEPLDLDGGCSPSHRRRHNPRPQEVGRDCQAGAERGQDGREGDSLPQRHRRSGARIGHCARDSQSGTGPTSSRHREAERDRDHVRLWGFSSRRSLRCGQFVQCCGAAPTAPTWPTKDTSAGLREPGRRRSRGRRPSSWRRGPHAGARPGTCGRGRRGSG